MILRFNWKPFTGYWKQFIFFILFSQVFCLKSQITTSQDTFKIKEVEINSERVPVVYSELSRVVSVISKKEIEQMPVQSVDDILKFALNVDVRQRGDFNVQSDISIRGGSGEETLILLNGVKINDPQTGHYNINIPVNVNDIERIEILEGPGARIFGPNAFSGAINIITVNPDKDNVRLGLAGGEHDYYSVNASANYQTSNSPNHQISNYISVGRDASSGYMKDSDFDVKNLFYQGTYKSKNEPLSMSLLISYLDKAYGADNFYSSDTTNYTEYEHTITTLVNLKTDYQTNSKIKLTSNIYWRGNEDKFELIRENPSLYTNYHLTNVTGADLNASYISKLGKTAIGGEYRDESILSNRLGNPLKDTIRYNGITWGYFDHSKTRNNINLFAEHLVSINDFSFSGGLLASWTNDYNWHIYPGIDASYNIVRTQNFVSLKAYASVNKSMRLPTFTDLYYTDPSHIGNPDLKPEEAVTAEGGIKYFGEYINSHLSVFRRYGTNIIDWEKLNPDDKWQSMNLNSLTTSGIEFSADILCSKISALKSIFSYLNFSYSYITAGKNSGNYLSYYALDYLRNKAAINISHKIFHNFSASWSYSYFARAGKYSEYPTRQELSYKPYSLLDGRINYNVKALRNAHYALPFTIYIEASNILNTPYIDYGNIQMPGRWLKAGIILNFKSL